MAGNEYALARIPITIRPAGYYLRWWYNGWHYWQFLAGGLTVTTQGEKYRTYSVRTLTVNSGQLTLEQVQGLRTIINATEVYLLTDAGWMAVRVELGSVKVYDNKFGGYEVTLAVVIGSRLPSITGYSPVAVLPVAPDPTYCEVVIGTQIWMCKAWDAPYPASKVYNDDEDNRAIFGGLYSWAQINNAGFVPAGWHVPTLGDWLVLINYVGGLSVAGGKLKAVGTDYWDSPNTDADDAYGFAARSTGTLVNNSLYSGLFQAGTFWSTEESDADQPPTMGVAVQLSWQYGSVTLVDLLKSTFAGVRLIKDTPAPTAERMILASFGGGTSPFSGFFRSDDDGLTWALSKTISEAGGEGSWFALNALTAQGGAHYFVGQGHQYDCILYDIDNDTLIQVNSEAGAGSSIAEDTSNGDIFIGAYNVGAGQGHGYRLTVPAFTVNTVLNISGDVTAVIYEPSGVLFGTTSGIYQIGVGFVLASQDVRSMVRTADGNVYAGIENGHIWKSEDNGSTWSDMGDKTAGSGIKVMCLIGSGRILINDYTDLWITDDQFVTVTKVQIGGAYGALLKVTESICLAFNANGGSYSGVYRSTDNGSTWNVLPLDPAFTGYVFGAIKYDL